ncbi:OLC1v1035416C1 [Oldenlandia corymbosa var. corymbosa]|uniref:OLC1v1035416C1 n=1 Tax=Oldenlandia corymbosa var. corymbosa TaxID=529605 RepID=A0AAV1CU50_OLDCO|nr:OLC1v1035416C1 [Oldenlandia corymbosa var. corymbosa]
MSSNISGGVVQMGKLPVHIAENGHSFQLDCDEYTLVEAIQRYLESGTAIQVNDQLLLCLDMKLEPAQPLSTYGLPSDGREVFLFNKARMRSNSPSPPAEKVEITDIPDPPVPSSHDHHPLDDATDPALKALALYERQFRYHFQFGQAIYSRTLAKIDVSERLFRELKVQERALEIAAHNLDHFYRMILQNYKDFEKFYSQQHRRHVNLLTNFGRDIERLKAWKVCPQLQSPNRRCLLDFVKEENFRKIVEDCSSSHRQFENKVLQFKREFGELKRNAEHLFSSKASFLIGGLETTLKEHQRYINEQKSIMQTLSKDVNTVKKLVDDSLTGELSSSLRPHDAVSALGPMYDTHDKNCLPKMQACDREISNLLDFCRDKKNEMNIFVHNYMQKIAFIQYTIKDVRYKFSVFQEALKRQSDQFEQLRIVRGIGPAYRACLAEVVRRRAAMKLYMGMAGQMAERLAMKREDEVRRREEFLKVHSLYVPRDVLTSMGLYDNPSQCDVNITPFDTSLLDIDIADIDRYAPEHLVGFSSKTEKQGSRGSFSMSNDSSHSAEIEESVEDFPERFDSLEFLEGSELVDIAGTSKIEVENAKLKAELASKIALICSMGSELDYELLDQNKVDSLLKTAAEKTTEALTLREEYEKQLQHMLKMKQIQCDSYEKRIKELEQRLSDQYVQGNNLSTDDETLKLTLSSTKTDDSKSEISGVGETHMQHLSADNMDDTFFASSSRNVKPGVPFKHNKINEGLDENMADSSGTLNQPLDSSMIDPQRDDGNIRDGELKDSDAGLSTSMAVSISKPSSASPPKTTGEQGLDSSKEDDLILELRSALEEKSSQLSEAESKLIALADEVSKFGRDLETNRKLLDESQMNCVHLENCLHEARKEAETNLKAADRKASEYSAVRASALKLRSLFVRLKTCVTSPGVAEFTESLRSLAQSLANSVNENENDDTANFHECVRVLADRVGILLRQRAELHERCSKAESKNGQLAKELEEKKELVNTLYIKHQHEKQANKEKISFGRLEVHEIAAFVHNSAGHYEAINRNSSHYYLSSESVALFTDHLPNRPPYIVGQIVHIERQSVRIAPSTVDHVRDRADVPTSDAGSSRFSLNNSGSTASNTYGLPVGCEYFVVTVAMLPDTTIHSPPPS